MSKSHQDEYMKEAVQFKTQIVFQGVVGLIYGLYHYVEVYCTLKTLVWLSFWGLYFIILHIYPFNTHK